MSVQRCLCCTTCLGTLLFTVLVFGVVLANGKPVSQMPQPVKTIVVDPSGRGNFQTIQSAIDSISTNNSDWICVLIKAGLYREKVLIPKEKEYIYLKGEGKRKTNIVYDDHDSVVQSPTFMVLADNFFAKSLSIANIYNLPAGKNPNPRTPAVAAMIAGNQSTFYRVGFYGLQDTLWDFEGRHYFKRCTIVGAVDFIFGNGQSLYEKCTLGVTAAALGPGLPGFITAQGRSSPDETNGFIFKDCLIKGDGLTYLGRPWRPYARVIFYRCNMSSIVVPPGWDSWYSVGNEGQLTFSEEDCSGPGSEKSGRVKWLKPMDQQELSQYTSMSFIDDKDKWIKSQPDSSLLG